MKKIEHKVDEKTAEHARKVMEELVERRKRQLSLLGEVYEINTQLNSINQTLESMIGMTVIHNKLPQANYRFSQDCSMLVAQIDETIEDKE